MLLSALNNILFGIANLRNYIYFNNIIKRVKATFPVISVGNVSFGGSGKTPFVIFLSKKLIELGYKPLILSRGYNRKNNRTLLITPNDTNYKIEDIGDEVFLIQKKLNIPIAVAKKKYKAIEIIEKNIRPDVVIIDDGFQHLKLFRDLDIVLIDKNSFKSFLREPLKNATRADILLIESGINLEKNLFDKEKIFFYQKKIVCFYNYEFLSFDPNNISEHSVALLSAIGNNKSFYEEAQNFFSKIFMHFKFRDHYYFSKKDIEKIISNMVNNNINYIVTTEKDFVKLRNFIELFIKNNIEIIVSVLEINVFDEQKLINRIVSILRQE
ncbi:MAG: tetraacyldisaccharide 4'-kinase [Ignavibacteria bacterium]|nr:tetraacyldisaccharide 4'-kinase [Ignavibacteria bacterium]